MRARTKTRRHTHTQTTFDLLCSGFPRPAHCSAEVNIREHRERNRQTINRHTPETLCLDCKQKSKCGSSLCVCMKLAPQQTAGPGNTGERGGTVRDLVYNNVPVSYYQSSHGLRHPNVSCVTFPFISVQKCQRCVELAATQSER